MNQLEVAKIQNTINQIENQISKNQDSPNAVILMQRAVYQLKFLLTHIGYLESSNISYKDGSSDE